MSENNLTRDEAQARAAAVRGASYDVTLDLTTGTETFGSTTVVRFSADAGSSTFLDLTAPIVRELVVNGTTVDPAGAFDGNRIQLTGLAADNEVRVVADAAYMNTGVGLHRFVDPVDDRVYLHTQFETFDAHRVYACFDQPDIKATFDFTVVAPEEWVVVANSPTTERPADGAAGTWRFETTKPMSTYITAIVAGSYHEVRASHGDIDLGIYCRRSMAEFLDADELFDLTRRGFDWFSENFDYPYPFGPKYDQLFVPEFNAGAMENAAAVTFLEDYVFRSKVTDAAYERRAETLLHEMAHMWFGDLVTMRWWDDLWLNESFATYASVLCQVEATRFTGAWTTFCSSEKTWALRQDQLPSTHPIAADMVDIPAVETNFDGITYAKGASVLRQLVAWVGQDAFLDGLRSYFKRHAFGNTELRDLLVELERSSGRDLSGWSAEWLETAGVNTLRASFEVDDHGGFSRFELLQEASPEWPTLRSHRVAVGLYDITDDGLVRRDRVELDVVGASTDVKELIGQREADLVLVNDDDLAYTKIRLDPRSLATISERLGDLPDSLPRALCWTATWDMTRDAEVAARDYVRMVLRNIATETDIGVVQSLLSQCSGAIYNYGDLANRRAALDQLATSAYEQLGILEPASDHQLAWARAFIAAARSEGHVAVVRGLLNGAVEFPGLAVDTELRWHLVRSLVALGEDDALIAAELERDATAAGERHAAAARAARPTAEAKAAAWSAVMDDASLPNAIVSSTMSGFQQPDQVDLLRPYAARYFEVINRIWDERTNEVANNIAGNLFPHHVIEPDTVELADRFLADGIPAPAIRRSVVESRDQMARSLRARAVDEAAG